MREKISQAAKGIFEYQYSMLQLSVSELAINVNAGEVYEGSFTITNELGREMRGAVNADSHFLKFDEDFFSGKNNEITFYVNATTLQPGEKISGNIHIISDCGTKLLRFEILVGVPSCEASSGKIRDLFHFTNLAKERPDEAATLFRNKHFEEIFLYHDNANIALYRGLSRGSSKGMAMEEFLIAIHKKIAIHLSVDKTSFVYGDCSEKFQDKFVLTKDNWGYGEYHITSDSDFVVPEHHIIWSDAFIGNVYTMHFTVDTDKMLPGKNYARITVSSVGQKMEITVEANKAGQSHEQVCKKRAKQQQMYRIMQLYTSFCMGNIEHDEYLTEAANMIKLMEQAGMSINTQLYRVHFGIMEHNEQLVQSGLAFLETQEEKLKQRDSVKYCAYLYLKGLWTDDEELIAKYVREIEEYYHKDSENWKYLWFLLYLSPAYQSEHKKYEDILKQIDKECRSPILYLEVCSILNETPELLLELTNGVCKAIHWGSKQGFVDEQVALRYCYLAGKMRHFSKVVLEDLCRFYEQYHEDEILASICKVLMKGQITTKEAFYWYDLGVAHNLKLTDLYEYYMYSIDENQEMRLQNSTLLYFLYDNHLTVMKKAMLYAYVVRNKESMPETYEAYLPVMEEYTRRQLTAGRISADLAVLYEAFIQEEMIDPEIAKEIVNVMFSYEISCDNPDIIGVYVTHRELKGEEFVPLVHGKAVVQIFTENHQIFLADKLDNRYALSIEYTLNQYLNMAHMTSICYEKGCRDYRLLLYLYDKAERMNQTGKDVIAIRKAVLEIEKLSKYHYKKAFCALVRFYYDNFEGELLDAALEKLDWADVNPAERNQFFEYCAVRRFFDKAMEGIRSFGFEKIDGKRLLKISSESFKVNREQEDDELVKIGWHIFKSGNFDENMMQYLCRYYSGSISDMVQIWHYAKGFSIDTADFSERILAQIIFTGEISPDAYDVFYTYYELGRDKQLIWAFLKYISYQYLIHAWMIPRKMFTYFYKEVQVQDNLFCLIASLKYLSQKKTLTEEEKTFADYNINKLYDKKMVFPFYRNFDGKLALPVHILDEYYVEYIANPAYEVKIHYAISSAYEQGEYVTETMRDIFCGDHVKEFVLFQDEMLQYYISEVRPEGEVITKSASVSFDETMDNERRSSRYHMLNLMMIAQEMNEENTLIDMMKEYVETKESVNMLFKPLD